jgi:hypothetical protein
VGELCATAARGEVMGLYVLCLLAVVVVAAAIELVRSEMAVRASRNAMTPHEASRKSDRWRLSIRPSFYTTAYLLAGLPEATAKYHDRLHGIDKRHYEVIRRKS